MGVITSCMKRDNAANEKKEKAAVASVDLNNSSGVKEEEGRRLPLPPPIFSGSMMTAATSTNGVSRQRLEISFEHPLPGVGSAAQPSVLLQSHHQSEGSVGIASEKCDSLVAQHQASLTATSFHSTEDSLCVNPFVPLIPNSAAIGVGAGTQSMSWSSSSESQRQNGSPQ